jgi:hypothetical protein
MIKAELGPRQSRGPQKLALRREQVRPRVWILTAIRRLWRLC